MSLDLDELRRFCLEQARLPVPPLKISRWSEKPYTGSIKLPPDFECQTYWNGYRVLVLTSVEAAEWAARLKPLRKYPCRVPHRILIHCVHCSKWIYAGKLVQHQKACKIKSQAVAS